MRLGLSHPRWVMPGRRERARLLGGGAVTGWALPSLATTLWPPSAEEDLMDEAPPRGIGESESGRKGGIHD